MSATEALVFDAIRTPRGKGKSNGSLHATKPVDLVVGLMHEMLIRNERLDPKRVDDVVLGCVTPIGDQGADIAKTVKDAVVGRMGNAGQACTAAKRMIVVGDLYDEFVSQFTATMAALRPGDPTDPASNLGPLSSETAAERLMEQISDAVDKGATLRTGGKRLDRPGAFVEPTVLTDVTPQMRAYHEELFGPAAVIYRVADATEAVDLANSSSFGLGGAVYSADPERAAEVADMLDTGMVWINSPTGSMADLPFGGTKRSGVGRELGPEGINEFVNKKLIYTPAPR
jgi:succinate-semialdehyde dehydrogenase/glutarate-semialdehyde dehydrogenase